MNEDINAPEPPCKTAPADFKTAVLMSVKELRKLVDEINSIQAESQKLVCDRLRKAATSIITDDLALANVQLSSIEKLVATEMAVAKEIEAQKNMPVYADVLKLNGQIESHIAYESYQQFFSTGKLIRTYNRANDVLFEDSSLAEKCINYNQMLRRASEKVKELMENGKIGLTTKFDDGEQTCDPAEQKLWDDAFNLKDVELREDEKLPEGFVKRTNALSNTINSSLSCPTKNETPGCKESAADALSKKPLKRRKLKRKKA